LIIEYIELNPLKTISINYNNKYKYKLFGVGNFLQNFNRMWKEYESLDIEIGKYSRKENEKTGWFIGSMSYITEK
jgi:hypothetical protein